MSKFAKTATAPRPTGVTGVTLPTLTHEGGAGWAKDEKTELFTMAVSGFMGNEDQYYESGSHRDDRFTSAVATVTKGDPEWVQGFIPWLRDEANIRTAAIMAAAEYVAAGGPNGRAVVSGACMRADEPAELLGYWITTRGRRLPAAIKRGLADAATRLYTERAALKWDSQGANVRMGDVIDMTHPRPKTVAQSQLFKYLLDVRHNRENPRGLDLLATVRGVRDWRAAAAKGEVSFELPDGMTWEALSSYTALDAEAWEAIIPKMGYMALLRNLRNFEQAKISKEARDYVINFLTDPDQVAASRQLPFRFYSAFKFSDSIRYGGALEDALELSMKNLPRFGGRTLVMVDTSGSMTATMSNKSKLQRSEAAALFGAAVASASDSASLWAYGTTTKPVTIRSTVIQTIEAVQSTNVGWGTNTWPSVQKAIRTTGPFDRILVFTDCQDHPSAAGSLPNIPVFVWDLGGYGASNIEPGKNRYLLGGLSDQSFKTVKLLEDFKPGNWPWE